MKERLGGWGNQPEFRQITKFSESERTQTSPTGGSERHVKGDERSSQKKAWEYR